ncbi:dephospho-CoA kinase [Kocuria atrinae]|uniref:dephospho-CoA kinase n=1 Tax=Kocuria atrinae TaxID=592377 RepID=UPI000303AC74|nr:dephospho-CoA kinase [Kocuria atrinae]
MALIGGYSAGKTTVAQAFEDLGATVVDNDEIWAHVLRPGTEAHAEIARMFGDTVMAPNGSVDLAALTELKSNNETARDRINELVLPLVREESRHRGRRAGPDTVLVQDVRDLVESGQSERFDVVIAVEAPADVRVERMVREAGITREEAWDRVDDSTSDDERREIADVVVDNDGDNEYLRSQVRQIWDEYVVPAVPEIADRKDAVRD